MKFLPLKFFIFLFPILCIAQLDTLKVADDYIEVANAYNKSADFEKAISNYLLATKILEKEKDSGKLATVYSNIGVINAKLKNLDKAIRYLEMSLDFSENNNNLRLRTLYNISAFYYDNKDIDQCLSKSKEAEELAEKSNNKIVLSAIYSTYCNAYRDLKDYKTSINYGLKSLALKKELKLNPDITINNIGYSYVLQGSYNQAITYLKKIENTSNKALQVLVYNNLKTAYERSNQKGNALNYTDKLIVLKDSLASSQQKIKVAEIVEKYEADKKQDQIDLLNTTNQLQESKLENQRNLLIGGGIAILLLGLLTYLWFKNQKTNQSLQQTSLQHKLLQTQLNPHFLFHSLNSIQSFIFQNKKEESSSYLVSYSKLMRSILESSDRDFITVLEDASALKEYIRLQKLNLPDDVQITVDVDASVENLKIPPMFIQPHLENALIHGINGSKNAKVSLSFKEKDDKLEVSIIDNGTGIKKQESNNELHRSMSTNIIEQRIHNLKQIHNYPVQISTNSNGEGTIVVLKFPKKV